MGRPDAATGKTGLWSLDHIKEHLIALLIRRKVDSQGKISVPNTQRFAGRDLCGRTLYVHFDPIEVRWVMLDDAGRELRRVDAPEVCTHAVRGMRMMYRMPCRPHRKRSP